MQHFQFQLQLSPERYLDYYRGTVRHVVVRCTTGQTVQFPASLLQRHVTKEGIQGVFILTCDENNRCVDLQKLAAGV